MTELVRVITLEGVMAVAKIRRKHLGLSQLLVDELSGLQNGYTGKLEAGIRGLGKVTIPLLLGALKLELAVMPAARQHRDKTDQNSENLWSRRGRELRAIQLAKQTPRQRKRIARAAAKARWRKVRAEQESTGGNEARAKGVVLIDPRNEHRS